MLFKATKCVVIYFSGKKEMNTPRFQSLSHSLAHMRGISSGNGSQKGAATIEGNGPFAKSPFSCRSWFSSLFVYTIFTGKLRKTCYLKVDIHVFILKFSIHNICSL